MPFYAATSYLTATAPEVVETTVITYTYDPLYRLTSAEYSSGESFAYVYDAVGNVTLASEHITTTRTTTYTLRLRSGRSLQRRLAARHLHGEWRIHGLVVYL
ncbi:MAG: hypothetical protein H5T62_07460 [Anaerolineae bacterium]|nr:hypothetical protein [Anaerolineae bacterium]